MKKFRFTVTVKTHRSKAAAKSAILYAFAIRQPDNCEFYTTEFRRPKSR